MYQKCDPVQFLKVLFRLVEKQCGNVTMPTIERRGFLFILQKQFLLLSLKVNITLGRVKVLICMKGLRSEQGSKGRI